MASLQKTAKDGRAHTFLFTGPSGVGKTTLARILAATLGATNHGLVEVDAATNSGADDMRGVVNHTHYRAIGGSPIKCIIMDECHRLSAAAWTILLKPTEEPPAHVYWMFCSTEPGKVPETIKTRCVKYALKSISEDLLLKLLTKVIANEKLDVPDAVADVVAEAAGGSPRQALTLLEACSACKTAAEAKEAVKAAAGNKDVSALCQLLIGNGRTWGNAVKIIKELDGKVEAEGARIQIVAYLQKALLNTEGDENAKVLLDILDAFKTPYVQTDRFAPLLYSVGLCLMT